MVAPNGARLTKADHAALPVTIDEIVATTLACRDAGADGVHAHVRDAAQQHVLDQGLYAELLAELGHRAPDMYVQITSEAAGRFTPAEQRRLVEEMRPAAVSIALREITAAQEEVTTRQFFAMCAEGGIGVQHILYDEADIDHLAALIRRGDIAAAGLMVLLCAGRYTTGQASSPDDVARLANKLTTVLPHADWAACAFGPQETACLIQATRLGGKVRIGFENNRLNRDGSIAENNAARVGEFVVQAPELGGEVSGPAV